MIQNKHLLIIAFAFTLTRFDSCGISNSVDVYLKGPFATEKGCDAARKLYGNNEKFSTTKCWKIPETE